MPGPFTGIISKPQDNPPWRPETGLGFGRADSILATQGPAKLHSRELGSWREGWEADNQRADCLGNIPGVWN